MKLARDLGVQQRTAWFLAHRIRKSMKVAVKVAPDTTGKTLSNFIGDHVEAGNTVYTDDHRGDITRLLLNTIIRL